MLMSKSMRRGIVLAALVAAALLAWIAIIPRIANEIVGPTGIHDALTLPEHIKVCGRSWSKDALGASSARPSCERETVSSRSSWTRGCSRRARPARAPPLPRMCHATR